MWSWINMLEAVINPLQPPNFHLISFPGIIHSRADIWKHPIYDEEKWLLKVFLKSAGHTSLSNISQCICFEKQFRERPSSGAAEHNFTTGSANQVLSELQQILPVPGSCSAPVKMSSHACSRNEQASVHPFCCSFTHLSLLGPPCMELLEQHHWGLWRSTNACLASAPACWEPRLPNLWAHPALSH